MPSLVGSEMCIRDREWADRMLVIRDEVNTIKLGLLPHTPEWASDFRTTLEWHKDIYQDLAEKAGGKEGELLALLPRKWEFRLDPKDIGVIYQWYLECNSEDWTETVSYTHLTLPTILLV